jgi:magnesium chelatase subunit I
MQQHTNAPTIKTLGELKASGYKHQTVKEELRKNLIQNLKDGVSSFEGIYGYEDSVIPDVEKAILSQHNILLLGLRGQAKTKIARLLTHLMDEWIPLVAGTEINDDPMLPITASAKEMIAQHGDDTPIVWMHRSERYNEKLATPDVNVADLIGDLDPIKAANMKLSLGDEKVIHYGIIPRSNKAIFVINELPDLQARIQVSLFNILQEGDIQIRGFKLRLPLDILFIFTANPEDYTNRGSIVTPLKDRIESQILTHYPLNKSISAAITKQESNIHADQRNNVFVPELISELIEEISMTARKSEFVDQKSGVSSRLTIAANELLYATAERRALLSKEGKGIARIADVYGVIPALTGKVELVYEGEQEGPYQVAIHLIGKAIRELFTAYFPNPNDIKKSKNKKQDPYKEIVQWFSNNQKISLGNHIDADTYAAELHKVPGLHHLINTYIDEITDAEHLVWMEFALHGLAEFSLISKKVQNNTSVFSDIFGSMMDLSSTDIDESEFDDQ